MYLIFRATRAKCTQEKHVEDKIEYSRNIREINCLLDGKVSSSLFRKIVNLNFSIEHVPLLLIGVISTSSKISVENQISILTA